MNKVVVLIFTDGRKEYFSQSFASFTKNVIATQIYTKIIIDDSDDSDYASWLDRTYGDRVDYIKHNKSRLGFGGTISSAWKTVTKMIQGFEYIFHLEDDFVFFRQIRFDDLIEILKKNRTMAQVCLLRQPWNYAEKIAGGLWQQHPERFKEKYIHIAERKIYYLAHREGFSTNPCMYPKWVVSLGWPNGPDSEEVFWNEKLLPKTNINCAYFGSKTDHPAVFHIGSKRMGIGY